MNETEVTCYAVKGKTKSQALCHAFASGVRACGGVARVYDGEGAQLLPGAAAFYGVRPSQAPLLAQAKAEGRDWYYIDNAYFDATREKYFRITRNRLQHPGTGRSTGARFTALKIERAPWRKAGAHVLVCPQSDEFARLFFEDGADWTGKTVGALHRMTGRAIRVRPWQANKVEWYRSLPEDLQDCWALVTYSSASAITAMLAGVPAFVLGADCISRPVANTALFEIDTPQYADPLLPWLAVVADNQFSTAEIMTGVAWRHLQAGG